MSASAATLVDPARVRVMKFMTIFALGGTEKQVVNTAARMDLRRFDLEFGCFKRRGQLLDEVLERGTPVIEYPVDSFFRPAALRQQFRLARHLQARHMQVMHSYNFYSNVFAIPAARLAGVPCIIASIRDTGIYLNAIQRRVHRAACSLAHRILVNADAIREWLVADGYDPKKISVIPNGLDVNSYVRRRGATAVRESLCLAPTARLVVMLARINRDKGIDCFVDAAARLAPKFPDAEFVIVGGDFEPYTDGSLPAEVAYRREVEARAARAGIGSRLHFTGFRTDVPEILAETAVSVLPSFSEGLSNTLLESMAAGVPVVATAVGGTPEAVEDGCSGLLVPPHDDATLAAAIACVLENDVLAARLGENGRRRVTDRYSFTHTVRATEQLYLDSLGVTDENF